MLEEEKNCFLFRSVGRKLFLSTQKYLIHSIWTNDEKVWKILF